MQGRHPDDRPLNRETAQARVLVVDDERAILRALRKVLAAEPYDVVTLDAPQTALELLRSEPFDVVLCDLRMPHMNGLELLEHLKAEGSDVEVIMMTAYATVETALQATRLGAFDYLTKPFENIEAVVHTVARAIERRRLVQKTRTLERQLEESPTFSTLIGVTPRMQEVFELIENVAATDANVLIRGETGTGKELVARALHDRSHRAHQPMIAVNCSALTETLLESELFGHLRGSFTGATHDKKGLFEAAHRGTLFLDELGDMALATQVKLLRVLQHGEVRPIGAQEAVRVDVRVVAATHVDLEEAMRVGRFREDLYWRLNVIRVDLPPLRERPDDIPLLAQRFLERAGERLSKALVGFTPDALDALTRHTWPGNVRELENVLERAVVLCRREVIDVVDLPERLRGGGDPDTPTRVRLEREALQLKDLPFREAKALAVRAFERRYVENLLTESDGNISVAAKRAGLDRSNFKRILTRHGIDAAGFRRN